MRHSSSIKNVSNCNFRGVLPVQVLSLLPDSVFQGSGALPVLIEGDGERAMEWLTGPSADCFIQMDRRIVCWFGLGLGQRSGHRLSQGTVLMMDIGKLQRCSKDTAFWRAKKHPRIRRILTKSEVLMKNSVKRMSGGFVLSDGGQKETQRIVEGSP